jgi:hypothetical protein
MSNCQPTAVSGGPKQLDWIGNVGLHHQGRCNNCLDRPTGAVKPIAAAREESQSSVLFRKGANRSRDLPPLMLR